MKPMLAPYMRPLTLLARAGMDARKALKRDPRLWRAHVALAVVHVCRREWNPAREEFDKALRINAAETRYHPWYAAFLMAIGKTKEALILVADRAEERPEDPFAHAIWGLFAYVARDFDTARLLLDEALSKNPDNWVACFASACVRLHSGDTDGVGERLVMRAHEQLHTEVFPGLYVLCLRTPTVRDKQSLDQELNSIAAHVQTSEYWSPLQTALGQMAFNEKEAALESLAEAFNDCTPYMAWMHLWPFLDPLRGEKKFQRLVGRMRLPASK
jgi:tetratricopeptide (TPR) repeat protein